MITITIFGIDPYLTRQISKAMSPKLAQVYECKKDDIDFFAPEGLFVHDGVEQNTWNILLRVNAPLKVKVMEKQAVRVIEEYIRDACVQFSIEFYYYSQDNRYEFIDETTPRFMQEDNIAYNEDEEEKDEEEEEIEEEEPYLGDAFKKFHSEE